MYSTTKSVMITLSILVFPGGLTKLCVTKCFIVIHIDAQYTLWFVLVLSKPNTVLAPYKNNLTLNMATDQIHELHVKFLHEMIYLMLLHLW